MNVRTANTIRILILTNDISEEGEEGKKNAKRKNLPLNQAGLKSLHRP